MNEQRRVLTLNQLFDEKQCDEITSLVERVRVGQVKLDTLKFYFEGHKEHLAAREVDATYLFYAVAYAAKLF